MTANYEAPDSSKKQTKLWFRDLYNKFPITISWVIRYHISHYTRMSMVNRLTIIVSWVYHRHCSVAVSPTVDRITRTGSAGVKTGKSGFWTGTVKPGKTGFWTGTIKTGFWSAIFGCLAWHRWIGGQGISAVFSMQNSCSWTRGSLASKVPRKFKLKVGWNYLCFFS